MGSRGRPRGKIVANATTDELKEWADVWGTGKKADKLAVINEIEKRGLDKDAIIQRLVMYHAKSMRKRELKPFVRERIKISLNRVGKKIDADSDVALLKEDAPDHNLVVNLYTGEVSLEKRPVPRQKRK